MLLRASLCKIFRGFLDFGPGDIDTLLKVSRKRDESLLRFKLQSEQLVNNFLHVVRNRVVDFLMFWVVISPDFQRDRKSFYRLTELSSSVTTL